MLIVVISRVHQLKDNFIIGTKEEAKPALSLLLIITNSYSKEINKRLNMLNVLQNQSNNSTFSIIEEPKIFLAMIDVSYTPSLHRFIYLSISRKHPFKTHFAQTNKNLKSKLEKIIIVLVISLCAIRFGKFPASYLGFI